jgi:cystathionine beta-synthase
VKDRIAVPMIEAAERAGLLKPGGTIVEPTSGNTGVGLAMAAAVRGYRCIFVMADKQSEEKRSLLRAYGAEVVVCPTDVDPDDERSYYRVSDRLAREIPGAWKPDQYANPENPRAHELATGPEIWEATAGRVTHFVAGIGTGGTISGVGAALRARNPKVVIVGADTEGSVFSGDTPRPYLTEGVGEDFWPATYDREVCDVIVRVSDRDSLLTARQAADTEGVLVGESAGTALWAALQVARDLDDPEALFVVLLPDSGRNYLGKLYNDDWLRSVGLLGAEESIRDYDWRATRPEVIVRRP